MVEFNLRDILHATGARLLQGKREIRFSGISTDSRTIKKGELFIALKGPNFDGHNFIRESLRKGAQGAIVSEKIYLRENSEFPVVWAKDTLASLRDIASFHRRRFNLPIVAITGSNGKTTTKEMTSQVLSSSLVVLKTVSNHNNQIGVSLALLGLDSSYNAAVVELGINHHGEMEVLRDILEPDIAVFTNVGRTHLEFLGRPEDVLKAKLGLIKKFTRQSKVIINTDDALLRKSFLQTKKDFSVISFGIDAKADFWAKIHRIDSRGIDFEVNGVPFSLPVLGRYNVYNALAAVAVASLFNITLGKASELLHNFHLPAMRMNVENCDDFILIDDSYNANPDSVRWAIETLADFKARGRKILVLADMLELGKYSATYHLQIAGLLEKFKVDILLTVGKHARKISEKAAASKNVEIARHFSSNQEAALFLDSIVESGDAVLFKGSRAMRIENILEYLRQCRLNKSVLAK